MTRRLGGQQIRRGASSRAPPGPLQQTADPEGGPRLGNFMRAERGIHTEHPPTLEQFPSWKTAWQMPAEACARQGSVGRCFSFSYT